MADINTQQEKEIGAMQSDIKHISSAVGRIEKMIEDHNRVHEKLAKDTEKRLSGIEFWVTAVKWGAGVFTTFLIMLFPAIKKVVNERPTQDGVVAIVKDELNDYEIKVVEK